MRISLLVPSHCILLQNLNLSDYGVLIQVTSDGVMWNGVVPLLFGKHSKRRRTHFISLWFEHFGISTKSCLGKSIENDSVQERNGWLKRSCNHHLRKRVHTKQRKQIANLSTEAVSCDVNSIDMSSLNMSIDKQSKFEIIIFPPIHINQLGPEFAWTGRLISWENIQIRLQSLNAFVSTLGGGYFLCHHLSTAITLARYQRWIAMQLNDLHLALRCTINEAYNYIHAGHFETALKMIHSIQRQARHIEDRLLWNVAHAAKLFAKKVRRVNRKLKDSSYEPMEIELEDTSHRAMKRQHSPDLDKAGELTSHCKKIHPASYTVDDFQRVRIVKDQSSNSSRIKALI